MQHNHNPEATWETTLVIPEATKPIDVQTLDALLRIEDLLGMIASSLQDKGALIDGEPADVITNVTPQDPPFLKAAKGKRK